MSLELSEREINEMQSCLADLQFRLPAEFYLVRDNNLPSQLSDNPNFNRYPRPTKWRLKVWKILLNTAFRKLKELDSSESVSSCAQIIGLFQTCIQVSGTFDEEEVKIIEEAYRNNPDLMIDGEEAERNFQKLTNLLDPDRFSTQIREERFEELGEFHTNFATGLNMIGNVSSNGHVQFAHGTTATQIYMFLLVFGDMLEKQRTVKRVYEIYCLQFEDSKAPHKESSFKQICHDLGFTGSLYRKRKRRVVSPS